MMMSNHSMHYYNMTGSHNMTIGHNMTGGHNTTGGHGMHGGHGGHNMTGGHGSHNMSGGHGTHGGGGGHDTHGGVGGHEGMQMWFTVGNNVILLFKEWNIDSIGGLIGAMIFLFVLGIIYEGIKTGREVLKHRCAKPPMRGETYNLNGGSCQKMDPPQTKVINSRWRLLCSKSHFIQTLLHMLQVFVGYLLMLAFMTYNTWLCIAVILGAGSGYFLFGWKVSFVGNLGDHCF